MVNPSDSVHINMRSLCPHVVCAMRYSNLELHKFKSLGRCADCNFSGVNRWLCLAKECQRIMCGDSQLDHSTNHFQEFAGHSVHQNLNTLRIWCSACDREVSFSEARKNDGEDSSDSDEVYLVSRPKGLQNIGNTCYMNAALQALCSIPPLSQYFLQVLLPSISEDKKMSLSRNFQRLMQEMFDRHGRGFIVPSGILYGIRSTHPMFRGYQQHDTQEFLRCFMDQLHEELKEPVPELMPQHMSSTRMTRLVIGDMDEEVEEEEDGNAEPVEVGGSSGSQSEAEYETCDSGVSERSSLSDEGERSSVKRKHSHSASPPARKIPQRPLRGPTSPSKLKRRTIKYRSIISDLFDGKLLSSVECLTCNKVSTCVETFQDLSLPIPSRDHVTMLHQGTLSPQTMATCSDVYKGKPTWVSWLWEWVKSWFWGPTVSLHDCLAAFFSADELKGDNMYSCEKCSKLRNGVKFSKVLDLPEVLCIHLKRFRHELAFSSKIASFVSFPLTGLDMRPYLHKDCTSKVTSYDLSSVICHHGTAGGGHYTCFAINPATGNWYQLDDQCVTPVPAETVANVEGYVLFYRKNNERVQEIFSHAMELLSYKSSEQSLIEFYVSSRWVNRLKTFAEPGPIDNSDFLCPHGGLHPSKFAIINNLTVILRNTVWEYLYTEFGGGPACSRPYLCSICKEEQVLMKQRTDHERNQYLALKLEFKRDESVIYGLSMSWFRQWEAFVQGSSLEPPGPIDNSPIVMVVSGQKSIKPSSDYCQVSSNMWKFFSNTYGGGPDLIVKQLIRGPSRASFSSGISVEREKIALSASKAKSVESLPVNLGGGGDAGYCSIGSSSSRTVRTHSVSSDNVNIRGAAASASHRKQQSLDSVKLERHIRSDEEDRRGNQRQDAANRKNEENVYCPAFTPDELDSYTPFHNNSNNTPDNVV